MHIIKTQAQTQAAALAQIEHINTVIQRSAEHMERNPENWGVTGDIGAILQRLHEVTQ